MIAAARLGSQSEGLPFNKSPAKPKSPKSPLSPAYLTNPPPEPPAPHQSRAWLANLRRPKTAPNSDDSALRARSRLSEDVRRDSGLLPTTAVATHSPPTGRQTQELSRVSSLPTIVVHTSRSHDEPKDDNGEDAADPDPPLTSPDRDTIPKFYGITTPIPTGDFEDLSSPDKVQFSQRGSMLLDGKRAAVFADNGQSPPETRPPTVTQLRPKESVRPTPSVRSVKSLSTDERELSQKVRSMYEYGCERGAEWPDRSITDQTLVEDEEGESSVPTQSAESTLSVNKVRPSQNLLRSPSFNSRRESLIQKTPYERAGGIEDWEDVEGGEVDRYGFILPKKAGSRGSNHSGAVFEPGSLQRVSTALADASESPRRKRTIRRTRSKARHSNAGTPQRRASKRSLQPNGSIRSFNSTSSFSVTQNPFRYASNRLPQNKDRRWMDEASDMLTLPPGLSDLVAKEEGGKAATAMKKKEWQREEKWRKMGKASQRSDLRGGGMQFDFDSKDPKLVERTWKGIPDRWRASAWYSFLAASAKKNKACEDEEALTEAFHEFQEESSADDVQIDCDVPRTINRHIMFRRRYRGGQRLLFRVLHALSLYFPSTGYVQGMATLAATLLCYYDEEQSFIMMVRLWQLRGLNRLYESGFGGLMEALDEFEKLWLRGGDVAKKLVSTDDNNIDLPSAIILKLDQEELGITSTAYGTRWYLTLFNYSIPFPAQLRVWDVFMLLGDSSNASNARNSFGADLDVLHATSAALVDATREILLDSDFENAMKVLTSWIPVKDEDLLMKVAHAEWKLRKKRT
jgi:hypothetical protein